MMGPVHENDTKVKVKAMRKMPSRPPVFSALPSTAVVHFSGKVSSKAPMNDMANTTRRRKKKRLGMAAVESALRAEAPNTKVTNKPNKT